MENLDWQKRTISYNYLTEEAKGNWKPMPMVTWLKFVGIIPLTTEWRRGNRHPNTNLDPNAIPAGYLAEVAHDWDTEGRTTPAEFVESLTFELSGHKNKQAVTEALELPA